MARKAKSRRVRGFWAKLALMILPVTLIVIGLEGAARLYVWKVYGSQDHGMNWKFMYEPYVLTRTDDRLHQDVPPKSDAFRVLIIGGSTANLLPSKPLKEALEPVIGREVEIVNYGQGAYILNQERITFLLHGIPADPDLLITLNGANDIVTASKTLQPGEAYANDFIKLGVEKPVLNGLLGMIRNSQFINCVNKLRERRVEGQAHDNLPLLEETVDHCEEALRSMAILARGLEIPHYMFLQPYIHLRQNLSEDERAMADAYAYRGDYTAKGFRALGERLGKTDLPDNARFIDATKAFDTIEAQCFIDEVHLTDAGNEALIAFMVQAIDEHGMKMPLQEDGKETPARPAAQQKLPRKETTIEIEREKPRLDRQGSASAGEP